MMGAERTCQGGSTHVSSGNGRSRRIVDEIDRVHQATATARRSTLRRPRRGRLGYSEFHAIAQVPRGGGHAAARTICRRRQARPSPSRRSATPISSLLDIALGARLLLPRGVHPGLHGAPTACTPGAYRARPAPGRPPHQAAAPSTATFSAWGRSAWIELYRQGVQDRTSSPSPPTSSSARREPREQRLLGLLAEAERRSPARTTTPCAACWTASRASWTTTEAAR